MIIPRFQHVSYLLVCVILLLLSSLQQTPLLEVQEWDCRGFPSSAALCRCCVGMMAQRQEAQSTQVSLEMAVPTPHSLAFPELLPARDSLPASLNPAAISSWSRGWWHSSTCAFLPPCARGTLLFSLAWGGSVCSCWEKLSPVIWQSGRAGKRMSWDLCI